MPVEVCWGNPCHTIITQNYTGYWSWDEFYRTANEQTRHMIFGTPHVVHVIADIQHSQQISMGGALTHVHRAAASYPDNWGLLVLINRNPFVNILVDLFKRNHPDLADRIYIAQNQDEAYLLVERFEKEHVA
jgi:hypothetical protein